MLQLRTVIGGEPRTFRLVGTTRIGRGNDNDILLSDYSVSRHHAVIQREADGWVLYDMKSTNGVQVNGAAVAQATLHRGDRLSIGTFEVEVEAQPTLSQPTMPPAPTAEATVRPQIPNATIVRPISEFYGGLQPGSGGEAKREALERGYGTEVFGYLTRLAGLLISADTVDEVLARVLEICFEAMPVERGFILLGDDSGEIVCRIARFGDRVDFAPRERVPVSHTILQSVMQERVSLLTLDAQSDARLTGGDSIRIHQIRAAMCAPLWSGERIIGVMQVDSPFHVGTFHERDLDFLTALANFAAVAVERIRYAHSAERERQFRNRLERYHSPAVIEAVLRRGEGSAESAATGLKVADVTVMFADLVGFTAVSEGLPPEEVAELLESFFTHAVEAIFAAGGTLDKFIGDCVMAFFGAPMAQPDHALRGVQAAIRIQRALAAWNEEREEQGLAPVTVRIAVNSGPVVVGDVGSNRRVDYTVLGNTVNVASRLEQFVARPGDIVIGGETRRQIGDRLAVEGLGNIPLKGLQRKVEAYRVPW